MKTAKQIKASGRRSLSKLGSMTEQRGADNGSELEINGMQVRSEILSSVNFSLQYYYMQEFRWWY